jgi:hypothetical protein
VSGPLPGPVHDKKAEWTWGVPGELQAAGLVVLADKGYQGAAHAKVPYRGKNKPQSQKDANRAHAKLRSPGERANAQLKNWRILRKLRCCPGAQDTRQGHPRIANQRGKSRMKKVQWLSNREVWPIAKGWEHPRTPGHFRDDGTPAYRPLYSPANLPEHTADRAANPEDSDEDLGPERYMPPIPQGQPCDYVLYE